MFDKIKDNDRKKNPLIFENPKMREMLIASFKEQIESGEWFDKDGAHLLHQISEANLPDLVEEIFRRTNLIDVRNRCNRTPLHQAAYWGNVEAGSALLKCGADIEAEDNNGATPIHFASEFGYPEMVTFLIEKGANLNCQKKYCGSTPLHFAALRAHFDVVEILLKNGANTELKNKSSHTPLDVAKIAENYKSIEIFEKYSKK